MKNKINIPILFSLVLSMCMTTLFTSCEKDYTGKYEMTCGVPTITFIRYQSNDLAGQLLDGAYMGDNILIIGENLTSIQEVWFNNVKALLNINLITKNTLFVTVPRDLPSEQTNKIYFVTGEKDTITYDFEVRIPAPIINLMKCEFLPEGADVVIYGDYFLATDPSRINVFIGDYEIPTSDIVSYEKTKIVFKAPPMSVKGQVEIKTLYGNSGRTKAIFRDDRGMITTFDDDYPIVAGWGRPNAGQIQNDPELALVGNYLRWDGEITDPTAWNGGYDAPKSWVLNYWGEENGTPSGNLFSSDPATSTLKFEVNVLQAWSAYPIGFLFYSQGDSENKIWDDGYPRGLWRPWYSSNGTISPYTTEGWITVSIPLKDFNLNTKGEVATPDFPTAFGGLTIVAKAAGHPGEACNPVILIDNIRVIP